MRIECPACRTPGAAQTGLLSKGRYELRRCVGCDSQFYRELDVGDGEERDDDLYWEAYKFDVYGNSDVKRAFEARYASVLEDAERVVGPISSVLDIGCGIGNFVEFAQRRGLRVVGSDVSPTAVEEARRRGLEVLHADAVDQELADESLDALTMWDVIEHLADPQPALEAALRKVRPGGAVLMETPDGGFPVRRQLLALNRLTRGKADLTGPMYYWEHKIYFTEEGLRRLLDAVGVDLLVVRRATSVREKMTQQFGVNARKGSRKARILKATWPVLETVFRTTGHGNKLLIVGRRR